MGLILAPNERWNSILHMRVVRNRFRFSGGRVSNPIAIYLLSSANTGREPVGNSEEKVNPLFNGQSAD